MNEKELRLHRDEIWKVIKEYPDYAVSNRGRIKRITKYNNTYNGRILQPNLRQSCYFFVNLYRKNKKKPITIHKLVTEAFLGKRPNGKQVNHKDGNKQNNNIDNLEYVTQKENSRHAQRNGLLVQTPHKYIKITVKMVRELHKTEKYNLTELGYIFNRTPNYISRIVRNKIWISI